jgi:hypothetical protein
MKTRKPKTSEPSLRDKLSRNFLEALEADFRAYGVTVLERMRESSPERYCELAGKLIMSAEPQPDGFEQCNSMEEIGLKLLKSVGVDEEAATDDMIEAAIVANDKFIARLEAIRDSCYTDSGRKRKTEKSGSFFFSFFLFCNWIRCIPPPPGQGGGWESESRS